MLADHISREERRELAIDIMASWGLEGMQPSEDTIAVIRTHVEGRITTEELIETTKNGAYRVQPPLDGLSQLDASVYQVSARGVSHPNRAPDSEDASREQT